MRFVPIVIAVLLASSGALAQAPDDETYAKAQEYFQAGKNAYDAKEYAVAIESFEQAYKLTPKPSAAFALAMAYRNRWSEDHDASKLKRAVILLREVLAQPDDEKKPKWAKTKELLDVLEPVLADLEAKQAAEGAGPVAEASVAAKTALILSSKVPGTRLRFDDQPEVAAPIVIVTTPGPHRVAAYADGYYTTSQEVQAFEGESLPFTLTLEERPAVLTVRSESGARVIVDGFDVGAANEELTIVAGVHRVEVLRSGRHAWSQQLQLAKGETVELEAPLGKTRKRRAVLWTAVISGGVAAAGGVCTLLAFAAQRRAEDIEDLRDEGAPLGPAAIAEHNDAIDERDDLRWAATWLIAGAAAGALATVYLYATDDPLPGSVAINPLVGGVEASLGWRF